MGVGLDQGIDRLGREAGVPETRADPEAQLRLIPLHPGQGHDAQHFGQLVCRSVDGPDVLGPVGRQGAGDEAFGRARRQGMGNGARPFGHALVAGIMRDHPRIRRTQRAKDKPFGGDDGLVQRGVRNIQVVQTRPLPHRC